MSVLLTIAGVALVVAVALIVLLAIDRYLQIRRHRARMRKRQQADNAQKKTIGTMDRILIITGIAMVSFTVYMIHLFEIYGSTPDTLITYVFMALTGEAGIMGWIKTNKDKRRDRAWSLEDRKAAEDAARRDATDQPRNEL